MRPRWILPPLAALFLGGALWIHGRGREVTPLALLESARQRLSEAQLPITRLAMRGKEQPPEQQKRLWAAKTLAEAAAMREVQEALRLLGPHSTDEVAAALLRERSLLYLARSMPELALADCRERIARFGPDVETLTRANDLCLWLGQYAEALEFAHAMEPIDPARARSRSGRSEVALADAPLAEIESLAEASLPAARVPAVLRLAQRAALLAEVPGAGALSQSELLELFGREEDRRRVGEWLREAAEHIERARKCFVLGPEPGALVDAVAGLQDLLLRGGADSAVADLGQVALALPNLRAPMPILARTAGALLRLGRKDAALVLVQQAQTRFESTLRPQDLSSCDLRDELEEWCLVLDELELWGPLRMAATELLARKRDEARVQLANFLLAQADLREEKLTEALKRLETLTQQAVDQHGIPVRAWLGTAAIARAQKQAAAERFALLRATKQAPMFPAPELLPELSQAWQRLFELQRAEGDMVQAEVSLSHAVRLAPERADVLVPLWHELGSKSFEARGVDCSYALYRKSRTEIGKRNYSLALEHARTLLADYPGLGPALELVSQAAFRLGDYPSAVAASLEILERGWPGNDASARLRAIPARFILAEDRLRWMELDARGSIDAVVERLRQRGDLRAAAMAARAVPAKALEKEQLPLVARATFEAGFLPTAQVALRLLPAEDPAFRAVAGLAVRVELAILSTGGQAHDMPALLEKLRASGAPEDPELVRALQALLIAGRRDEAAALLGWLLPQAPPFLDEALLCSAVLGLLRDPALADDDLEQAEAFFTDGRVDLGRLLLALERALADGGGSWSEVEREARLVLATPLAGDRRRRLLLEIAAGDPAAALATLGDADMDGRDILLEFGAGCLRALDPALLETRPSDAPALPDVSRFLGADVTPRHAALLALAADVAPWSIWTLARLDRLASVRPGDPWLGLLAVHASIVLGERELALKNLVSLTQDDTAPALAWSMRARIEGDLALDPRGVLESELSWLAASGLGSSEDPALTGLRAQAALARGVRDEAVHLLESALERTPDSPELLAQLVEIENVPGRRARAIELHTRLLVPGKSGPAPAAMLSFLALLRQARENAEISETRWWSEVEAVEAEFPADPAPVRELVQRGFERPGPDPAVGRSQAVQRLERLRLRTTKQPLETLRAGELRRWTQLLARFTPELSVHLAEEERAHDPGDPRTWLALAEAELAAGRREDGIRHLESLERVAPDRESSRMLALASFQIEDDPLAFEKRRAAIERIDPGAKEEPRLAFYGGIAALRTKGAGAPAAKRAHELWGARAAHDLDGAPHARALALALHRAGEVETALQVLGQCSTRTALEADVLRALVFLLRSAPPAPEPAPPASGAEASPDGDSPVAPPGAPTEKKQD